MFFKKLKCCFCKEQKGLLYSVHTFDIYGKVGHRIHYHQECLEMVEVEPEKFGHRMIDQAIEINDVVERCKSKNEQISAGFKKKVDTLHTASFQRMMPTK